MTRYPALAQPMVDGVRCMMVLDLPVDRQLQPIANKIVRDILTGLPPMDGVLCVGDPRDKNMAQKTLDAVSNPRGIPKFTFWVFDCRTAKPMPLIERLTLLSSYVNSSNKNVKYIGGKIVKNDKQRDEYEAQMLLAGHERIMLRDLNAAYSVDNVPYIRDDQFLIV